MKFIGDKIAIGEIPAADIAAKFGTPTYVYDEQKIRKNYRRAFNAFAKHYPDFKMFYAGILFATILAFVHFALF